MITLSNQLTFKVGDFVRCAFSPDKIGRIDKITPRFIKNKKGLLFKANEMYYKRQFNRKLEIGDEVDPVVEITYVLDEKGNPINEIPKWDESDEEIGIGYSADYLALIGVEREENNKEEELAKMHKIHKYIRILDKRIEFFNKNK